MKIYFAGAIRGGRSDIAIYHKMIKYLLSFGQVLTEHVGDMGYIENDGPDAAIHDRDMAWLRECDLIVAEVTQPSLGVGYELGWACALKKPVLSLYRPEAGKRLSAMIAGSDNIVTAQYSDFDHAREIIREFIMNTATQFGTAAD
jgi:2'-deoxynucleoside 5'-phosphate N-hydrolase